MKNPVLKMSAPFFPAAFFALLLGLSLVSCGEKEGDAAAETTEAGKPATPAAKTPQDAYAQLVAAAKGGNYGAMYDLMDSANKHYTGMWFDLNLQQLDRMDSAERAGWMQFRNIQDPRDRFIRLVEVTPPMRDRFVNGYKVLSVDTVVAVVTQNVGSNPQITYFRWEDGGYKYTAPPESKIAPAAVQIPSQRPPQGRGAGPAGDSGANKR